MRIAVVSDIHGNRTAFEAVLADLRQSSPDLILHGGDLANGGANPAEVVDRIRDLGWQGVIGNTDECYLPESLTEFANQTPKLQSLLSAIADIAKVTREGLGRERLAWLAKLPRQSRKSLASTYARSERCGATVDLRITRTAYCRLCAYPSPVHSECRGNERC